MKSVGPVMVATDFPTRREAAAAAERSLGFGVAICLCAAAAMALVEGALGRAVRVPSPSPSEVVNPNTAPASSLVRLPGIGWSKAQAIVAHRERVLATTKAPQAFRHPSDLMQVPGIGLKTVEAISVWLDFDEPPVASQLATPSPAN